MKRSIIAYVCIVGACLLAIWFIVDMGGQLMTIGHDTLDSTHSSKLIIKNSYFDQFMVHVQTPLSLLLLQLLVVFVISRLFGMLAKSFGQQSVMGEIMAGILLGPSLLGWAFPEFSNFLFAKESLSALHFLSQIGLAFFMFIIGLEFEFDQIRKKAKEAIFISHVSIVFPFFLGMALAYFIYPTYAPVNVGFLPFSLFMGISMSITAFPILARILRENGMSQTPLGTMAITCAASDDITAWFILAVVLAIAKAGSLLAIGITLSLTIAYVIFMFKGVRPWVLRSLKIDIEKGKVGKRAVSIFIFILLVSTFVTEVIGIHALFGAFLAGLVMPRNSQFKFALTEKIEDVSVLLLMPLFFVITGLRTYISLLNQQHLWILCGITILIAVIGKLGGGILASKIVGLSWKDSFSIGILMNTRGLMELVVLNIGYDLGILDPEIFTILVIMALVTTLMTSPLLNLVKKLPQKENKFETS